MDDKNILPTYAVREPLTINGDTFEVKDIAADGSLKLFATGDADPTRLANGDQVTLKGYGYSVTHRDAEWLHVAPITEAAREMAG